MGRKFCSEDIVNKARSNTGSVVGNIDARTEGAHRVWTAAILEDDVTPHLVAIRIRFNAWIEAAECPNARFLSRERRVKKLFFLDVRHPGGSILDASLTYCKNLESSANSSRVRKGAGFRCGEVHFQW